MSQQAFDAAINFVLPHEEEFARNHWGDENHVVTENVEGDPGGLTKYGIDAAGNPGVDIANLDKAGAVAIYKARYWDAHNLDALPDKLAIAAFDVWVNGGHAAIWLQDAYNATHSDKLAVDGELGPASLLAMNEATPEEIGAMVKLFIDERNARFESLAQKPSLAKFLAGWEQRDADLETLLLAA